jgi:hypothetical protein
MDSAQRASKLDWNVNALTYSTLLDRSLRNVLRNIVDVN